MRQLVLIAALVSLPALAQAPAQPAAPKAEVAKPEATKAEPQAQKSEPAKSQPTKTARKPNPKRNEDARGCLDKPSNTEIIKCAEAYL